MASRLRIVSMGNAISKRLLTGGDPTTTAKIAAAAIVLADRGSCCPIPVTTNTIREARATYGRKMDATRAARAAPTGIDHTGPVPSKWPKSVATTRPPVTTTYSDKNKVRGPN